MLLRRIRSHFLPPVKKFLLLLSVILNVSFISVPSIIYEHPFVKVFIKEIPP